MISLKNPTRPLEPREWEGANFWQQVLADLMYTGFSVFERPSYYIDMNLINRLMEAWGDWFEAGGDKNFLVDKRTQSGWFPVALSEKASGRDEVDYKEYFHYFPEYGAPDALSVDTHAHYLQMRILGMHFLERLDFMTDWMWHDHDHPSFEDLAKDSENHLLRILCYPALPTIYGVKEQRPNFTRAAPHTDINMLTFIPTQTAKGLQVWTEDDGWLDVPIEENCIIVNVGDALELASEKGFKSAKHRVIIPEDEDRHKPRISMPFFLHARPDAFLTPNITGKIHLEQRLRELGVK